MKKLLALLLAVCMCFAACVTLASCDKHTHAFKSEWDKDATHHWHVCEGEGCTEVADKAEHTWNEGEITTAATHGADGVKTFTCTACAATKTEAVQGDFTVTAEEWVHALDFIFNYDNLTYTSTGIVTMTGLEAAGAGAGTDGDYDYSTVINKNGTDFSYYISAVSNTSPLSQEETTYFFIHGAKYYPYLEGAYPSDWQNVMKWDIIELMCNQMFFYSDFTYNAATGAYEGTNIVYDMSPGDGNDREHIYTFTECSFRFLDGKLIGISQTFSFSVDGITQVSVLETTITYGTAPVVEIPANLHRPS